MPNGQPRFVSTHGTFEYLIPADWGAVAANSYGAGSSKVIEEIYPASEINAEYCRYFVYVGDGDYEAGAVENEVYDNGHVQGCLIVWDVRNVQQGTEWRHISFVFFTGENNEGITVIMPLAEYDEEQALGIINSVQVR